MTGVTHRQTMMVRCATEPATGTSSRRLPAIGNRIGGPTRRRGATITISLFGKKQQDYESDMQYGRVHRAASLRIGGIVGASVVAAPGLAFGAVAARRAGCAARAAAACRARPWGRLTVRKNKSRHKSRYIFVCDMGH